MVSGIVLTMHHLCQRPRVIEIASWVPTNPILDEMYLGLVSNASALLVRLPLYGWNYDTINGSSAPDLTVGRNRLTKRSQVSVLSISCRVAPRYHNRNSSVSIGYENTATAHEIVGLRTPYHIHAIYLKLYIGNRSIQLLIGQVSPKAQTNPKAPPSPSSS